MSGDAHICARADSDRLHGDAYARGSHGIRVALSRPDKERQMTKSIRSITLGAGILLLAGAGNASAQINYPVEFTTTFPFTVGYATVPAGTYTIKPDDDNPELLELTGGRVGVIFQTNNASARDAVSKTEVVFKRYGDAYVLKSVWLDGSTTGAESVTVEGERHLTKSAKAETEERIDARKK
jgi:hypothetical protein